MTVMAVLARPQRQRFVERLSERTLNMVRTSHDQGTEYITVDLPNQANAEASATREYRGRYLFELLQNANDAISAAKQDPNRSKSEPYRVRIELTDSALIVANDGLAFAEDDVSSIYRWGESSKDPNKSIGHKGIGFKSVLEITDSPEIFSQLVQFRFDRSTCYREVRHIVGREVELKLPITRFVFPYTVERLRPPDRDLVRQLLHDLGFATVIRLPFKRGFDDVLERVRRDIDSTLLLFLGGIDELEIWVRGERVRSIRKQVEQPGETGIGRRVTLSEDGTPSARWLLYDAPKRPIRDRAVIAQLGDQTLSRVEKVGFAVAFPLDSTGRLQPAVNEPTNLFVYFPTKVSSGLLLLR